MLMLSSADFFQNLLFQKKISGSLSECQMVWIQIRTNILAVLIWVQTVCEGNQQTTKVAASKKRVNILNLYSLFMVGIENNSILKIFMRFNGIKAS